jgi:hypothetical protein
VSALRDIGRFEALAVLRGERDANAAKGKKCCAAALQRAIDVLSGGLEPLGPACSMEHDVLARKEKAGVKPA